jgi:hypothetical protein
MQKFNLKKKKYLNFLQISLIILICAGIFILVYSPHFSTPFPIHADEWQHITQANQINKGVYNLNNASGSEFGFDYFLSLLGKFTNLILAYQYFPAIWTVLTSLLLFFLVYHTTKRNFLISILAIIFFGMIKSNSYVTGLWFFTPLTFAIPFIFLYMFFFIKGLEKEKKKYLIISLIIMSILIPIHALAVLFSIPILILLCITHFKYIKREYRFFLLFLVIPIIGLIFYSLVMKSSIISSFLNIINLLKFQKGWGGTIANISFLDLYSWIGYTFALVSFFYIILKKKKEFYPYLIWAIYLLVSILSFSIINISYLAPYERNFYYFVLSLPFLSALGVNFFIDFIKQQTSKIKLSKEIIKRINNIIILIIIIIIITLSYLSYYKPATPGTESYWIMLDQPNYKDLIFLSKLPVATVIVPMPFTISSEAISGQKALGNYFNSYSSTNDVIAFYANNNCSYRNSIIEKYNVSYLLSLNKIDCNYTILSDKYNFIYDVKNESN